jgi:hypothetical protein
VEGGGAFAHVVVAAQHKARLVERLCGEGERGGLRFERAGEAIGAGFERLVEGLGQGLGQRGAFGGLEGGQIVFALVATARASERAVSSARKASSSRSRASRPAAATRATVSG